MYIDQDNVIEKCNNIESNEKDRELTEIGLLIEFGVNEENQVRICRNKTMEKLR